MSTWYGLTVDRWLLIHIPTKTNTWVKVKEPSVEWRFHNGGITASVNSSSDEARALPLKKEMR